MQISFSIICGILVAFGLTWGILLQFGILSILVPGYNMKAKNEDAKYFEKIYCKYVGIFILLLSIIFGAMFYGLIYQVKILTYITSFLGTLFAIFGIFYLKIAKIPRLAEILAKAIETDPDFLSKNKVDMSIFSKFKR